MTTARDDYLFPVPLPDDSVATTAHATYLAMCNEIDFLRRWKREALDVITAWDACFDEVRAHPSVTGTATLGRSKSDIVHDVLREYRTHICSP